MWNVSTISQLGYIQINYIIKNLKTSLTPWPAPPGLAGAKAGIFNYIFRWRGARRGAMRGANKFLVLLYISYCLALGFLLGIDITLLLLYFYLTIFMITTYDLFIFFYLCRLELLNSILHFFYSFPLASSCWAGKGKGKKIF